ncbi:EamA family transporter, partial [Xanthomonas cannabis]
GLLIALLAAVISAIVAIQIKQLSRNDDSDTVVFYTYVFWVPMSLIPALFQWTWPQGIDWLWLVATGIFGTAGQLFWTRALKLGEVSALQPISFMQLPLVALLGWWLFGEAIERHTVIGAAIIIGANVYIAHREAVLARRAATHAPVEGAKPGE